MHKLNLIMQQLCLMRTKGDISSLPPLMHYLGHQVLPLDQLPSMGVPPSQSLPVEPLYPLYHLFVLLVSLYYLVSILLIIIIGLAS